MNDACGVRRRESRSNLNRNVERFLQLYQRLHRVLSQSLAINKFGGNEGLAIYFSDLMDGENVRVIQRRGSARLLLEAAQTICI